MVVRKMALRDKQGAIHVVDLCLSEKERENLKTAIYFKSMSALYRTSGGPYWECMAWGAGKYVALEQQSDKTAYSENGEDWFTGRMPIKANWKGIAFGNGKFVATAYNMNKIAYSDDGSHWLLAEIPTYAGGAVAFGNGKFIASTLMGKAILYSNDGINWSVAELGELGVDGITHVAAGGGKFVAVPNGTRSQVAAYSDDCITWKTTDMPNNARWAGIATNDRGIFVVTAINDRGVDTNAVAAVSIDGGVTWQKVTMPTSSNYLEIAFGLGRFFVIASAENVSASSSNGTSWSVGRMPDLKANYILCHGAPNGVYEFRAIRNEGMVALSCKDFQKWTVVKPKFLDNEGNDITEAVAFALGIT